MMMFLKLQGKTINMDQVVCYHVETEASGSSVFLYFNSRNFIQLECKDEKTAVELKKRIDKAVSATHAVEAGQQDLFPEYKDVPVCPMCELPAINKRPKDTV